MNRVLILSLLTAICAILPSCSDHDDPKLSPIDTSDVKITATVTDSPNTTWMDVTEEMTINVSNVNMTAPKGVVLRSISLIGSTGNGKMLIDEKPFSGEPLEFKVPLTSMRGRINFTLQGNLIKKDSRDAEIIIADNIQKIIFSEAPKFNCEGKINISVKSTSTSGEEYTNSFTATSDENSVIQIPQNDLYWTPTSGTASTIELSVGSGASAWSPNTTFDCKITKTSIGNSTGDDSTLKITIPNTPGSLNSLKLQMYVQASFFGTWENVTIEPYNIIYVFHLLETK